MQNYDEYLEEEFVIFNSKLRIRDFVSIGKVEKKIDKISIWLEEPYEMVGPLCLEELHFKGEINFESCIVMHKNRWEELQEFLLKDSYIYQQRAQKEFQEDINNYNKKRKHNNFSESNYRKLLNLPLEGLLDISQIKTAFRKVVKKAHPDVGGSHEEFLKISEAKDALIEIVA